ncbi:hypothetical protein PCASD_18026 [Puccinia coronata f. sp. avenae]|uniref:Myb/SANT-like domain-containing protein n=1 Tax=Puccinia coronata f. sp. avenae TaxID=200324 RepID=A0A2N5SM83_9BASI|nr:hypothetical protein PCASD_18026 [Puccinia coronata f. sp. avenae]
MPSSQPKSKRLPNFLPEEDEQLAKSWALISQDPITANQQGRDDFFICIANDYSKFTPGPQRDANGLQNRWKTLQKSTLLFTSIYNQISKNPASGSGPTDWLVEVKQTFYE